MRTLIILAPLTMLPTWAMADQPTLFQYNSGSFTTCDASAARAGQILTFDEDGKCAWRDAPLAPVFTILPTGALKIEAKDHSWIVPVPQVTYQPNNEPLPTPPCGEPRPDGSLPAVNCPSFGGAGLSGLQSFDIDDSTAKCVPDPTNQSTNAVFRTICSAHPKMSNWHLLKQNYGGEMQLVKGLTKHECEFLMHRALGQPATDEEITKAAHEDDIVASDKHMWHSFSARDDYSFFQRCSALHNCGGGSFEFLKKDPGFSVISPPDSKSAECFE